MSEITKESLRKQYIDWAEAAAASASKYTCEPLFQAFFTLDQADKDQFFGTLGYGTTFPDNMDLYKHIRYCFLDDGDLSFVRAKFSVHLEGRDLPRTITEYFVMHGDFRELGYSTVLGTASRHHIGRDKELLSYRSVPFHPDLLDAISARRDFLNKTEPYNHAKFLMLSTELRRDYLRSLRSVEALSYSFLSAHIAEMMLSNRHKVMQPLGRSFSYRAPF
jgi:hypothetical protein